MRITMQSMNNNILNNLNNTTTDLGKLNEQISTGRQMSKLSDNPVNLTIALSLRTNLSSIVQYQENLNYGKNKLDAAESSLSEVKTQLIRGKTLALQAVNATVSPEGRMIIASEVHNLYEQAVSLSNSELGGKYLFGGYRNSGYTTEEPTPFTKDRYDGYRLNGNTFTTIDQNAPPVPMPLPLVAGDLTVNGIAIADAVADGTGLPYEDMSATAVAKTINDLSAQTGVTANIVPAQLQGTNIIGGGPLLAGDLTINGQNIITALPIQPGDSDNTLTNAINAQTATTGITATNNGGNLLLTAVDGRNLQIETSAAGEASVGLPDTGAALEDVVYFGSIQLRSDEKFQVKGSDGTDTALSYLGVDGGTANSGEPDDVSGDGEIWVRAIAKQEGSIRYNGDREHEAEIKISRSSTLAISKRGNEAFSEPQVFSGLKRIEDALRGLNYTEVTGTGQATAPGNTLSSGLSGLNAGNVIPGNIEITITDHDYYPAQDKIYSIPVDPAVDTPETMRQKLAGIPGLNASWDADFHLEINSNDPDRYTVAMGNDTSNFMQAAGITPDTWQTHALQNSIGEMDSIMENLTTQISDIGARQNRIENHTKILKNVEFSNTEALSEKQDVDITEALLKLKSKQFAYEVALQAAAKTMQLSLVQYL